ncbi:hypothetical protein XELAEV_18022398mg [Xenopus laevis]|uniref:exodeoxyribonuclease III n=1 Tax=Xenopus laevis TaxID=8355 RepID=A0A974D4W5_XENLA|nr:hypothetical protein XELAEV_18022398mg [Xenopus laevis]
MADNQLNVLSLNLRGLNSYVKHNSLKLELKNNKTGIALIQETHFKVNAMPKIHFRGFNPVYVSKLQEKKAKGTAILIADSIQWSYREHISDNQGHLVAVKGNIGDKMYTFASVYLPNTRQLQTLKSILHTLDGFTEGTLIIGGDLNLSLEPMVIVHYRNRLLHSYRMIDVWRTLNPNARDDSYYSSVQHLCSWIDYLPIPYDHLSTVKNASIGPITWSDHAPNMCSLDILNAQSRTWQWKLNESLLEDPEIANKIQKVLNNYFRENTGKGPNNMLVWEAHKCVVRGEIIKVASQKKKERKQRYNKLYADLISLEQAH